MRTRLLACALLAAVCGLPSAPVRAQDAFDLLIVGGELVDGTGAPPRRADVGVADGRIAAVGALKGREAKRTVDATGLCVAPGFVDVHAHADRVALRRPRATNFVSMGVTTLVTGNCGSSVLDVGEHLRALEEKGIGVNYATLIGHGTVRSAVLGTEQRAPTADELVAMRAHVRAAMEAGAFGLSTGLIYVPGTYAELDEIAALCEEVAPFGGLYATHMRNEASRVLESIAEALEIGRRAGVPVHLSHLKSSGKPNWGRSAAMAARLQEARAAGVRVTGDQYAYTASSTSLDVLFPSSALSVGRKEFCTKLSEDAAFRDAMREALHETMAASGFGDLSYAQVASAPGAPDVNGLRLSEVAEKLSGNATPEAQADAAIELMVRSAGRRVGMVYHKMCEPDVERLMRLPFVAVASDSGIRLRETAERPHPRGAGNNPRVLGRYVRERNVLSLALAIHKMSGLPAATFHLRDRGTIRPGAHADLVIFDPETVLDGATYDAPTETPVGIPHVFVNGVAVVEDGAPTGALPGHVLRLVQADAR